MSSSIFFEYVIYILCSIALITLIFLFVKVIITLGKVDKLVDDLQEKSRKVDGAFNAIDKVTDAISAVNDKFLGVIFNAISNIDKKKKVKKEEDEDNE